MNDVTLYSAETGKREVQLNTRGKFMLSLKSKYLASGAVDGIIVLFDVGLGARKALHTL